MKYEVSNTIFKRKPTGQQMTHAGLFKRGKAQVYLVQDEPTLLYKAWELGHNLKPRAFDKPENATVHTIVLDFDHLNKGQVEFVKSVVNGKYIFKEGTCGDYSAGTKSRMYENRDIPNYEPEKIGYKVFYPVDCLCVYDDINNAFLEAVAFFNPYYSMDEVKRVWGLWLKANNKKTPTRNNPITVNDEVFKGWILPDVAMLNSFRTQITYGVNVELKKTTTMDDAYFLKHRDLFGIAKFPATGRDDYKGLDWKPQELDTILRDDDEPIHLKEWIEDLSHKIDDEVRKQTSNPDIDKSPLTCPYAKSHYHRLLGKSKFDDLVVDEKMNGILAMRIWNKSPMNLQKGMDDTERYAKDITKTLTRGLLELAIQQGENYVDYLRQNKGALLHDIITCLRRACGLNILTILLDRRNKSKMEKVRYGIARTITMCANNYTKWRKKMKLKHLGEVEEATYLQHLRAYNATKDIKELGLFQKGQKEYMMAHWNMADEITLPYTYTRKGVKKELILGAIIAGLQFNNEDEWIEWAIEDIATRSNTGEVSTTMLERWYADYKREFNTYWGKQLHQTRIHNKSKWSDLFEGKTKDEIAEIINKADITKGMRYKLRKTYL